MMKLTWIFFTIFALAVALVVRAPASLLDAITANATHQTWRLAEARGSVWHGEATVTYYRQNRAIVIAPIAWKILPASLLKGELRVLFGQRSDSLEGVIVARRGEIEASRLSLELNADAARNFLPTRTIQTLVGRVIIDAQTVRIKGETVTGNVNARWKNAAVLINGQPLNLGDVTLTFADQSAGITNQRGEIDIKGNAQRITLSGAASGEIAMTPNAATSASTRQLLSVLGGDAGGRVVARF